jgi:exo-beta-1,3-glucanase (GH17 family)/uncharacterized membrane protein
MPNRAVPLAVLLAGAVLTLLAWWLPNRPQAADVPMPAERFNSVSFAPFRAGHSPLTGRFPTAEQVAEDLRLIAPRVRAIRTYAAIEGEYETAALAARQGLKVWQGIWLGRDLAQNEREVARAVAAANRFPDTVERVVVGNEVLLRRDLPVERLAAHLDSVRAQVRQPVTYADVWEFWVQHPELARHVDIITIHILPYWEDEPTGVGAAMAHVRAVYRRVKALFPDQQVAIGEIGWPSRGRWREAAAPSRVDQAVFLRQFIALSQEEGFDYNLIEAFDQVWKYRHEGTVGAAWGLWTADRAEKFPLAGPVVENPDWPAYAAAALLLSLGLWLALRRGFPAASWRLALLCIGLGNALAFAWAGTVPYVFDRHLFLAALVNLPAQALLAGLLLWRLARRDAGLPLPPPRDGAAATEAIRSALRLRPEWRRWRDTAFDDLSFVFLWAATVLQLLLLLDPRYRDFPFASFAVPLVAVAARAGWGDLPRGGGGRAELLAGGVLAIAAIAGGLREHVTNLQAMGWTLCALLLAVPPLLRMLPVSAGRTARHPDPAAPAPPGD